jgi:iron complex outermembrane receptor protein
MPGIFQSLEAIPFLLGPTGPIGPCPPPDVVAGLPTPGPLGCAGNPNNIPLDLDFQGVNDITVENYSAFLHGTFDFTDQWSLSAGARYTYEKKEHDLVYGRVNSGYVIAPPGTVREDSWDVVTPKASLNFKFSDSAMTYLSASRGFRSGGYNGRPFYRDAVVSFDPEYVWAYELGLKSEWLDRRLIANLAIYYNDYTDMQLTANVVTSDGNVAVITENAGEAEIKGFEMELHARPVEQFDLVLGVGYTDAKFTEVDPGATVTEDSVFLKTPEWDVNLGAEYRIPIGASSLALRADYNWRSEWFNDTANTPNLQQDDVGLLNARITFATPDRAWQFAAYGTNLTDERYITGGVGGGVALGFDEAQYGRPREYGVTVRFGF